MELKKESVQALVIADTFNNNFYPISLDKAMAFFPVAGVPLVNFVLESLAAGGVDETILFCHANGLKIQDHIKAAKKDKAPWTLTMEAQVIISDTCRSMGDVMREIDASGLIRGNFILTGINAISNIPFAALLDQHIQTCKKDKDAAMTLLFKKVSSGHKLISSESKPFIAVNGSTNKVLMYQKYKPKSTDKTISLPLDIVLNHPEVQLHYNLADANIALCSSSVLPLFSDNFDFQTKDDFIYGILINDLLSNSLYYMPIKDKYYAATVTNWKTFQSISHDILHHWGYPLTIETGSFYKDNYIFLGNHNFKHKTATLSRSCVLEEDVLIGKESHIGDEAKISKSFIGCNCQIGNNVTISGSHILNNVTIKDNCNIINSYVDDNSTIEENCNLSDGVLVRSNVIVKNGCELVGAVVENSDDEPDNDVENTEWENESLGERDGEAIVDYFRTVSDSGSDYSLASSDDLDNSVPHSPEPDDTNLFLNEVIDSLTRGYEEKLKCDYLILEINSSRYAYNIQLTEVNFFVIRALLSMPVLADNTNVLGKLKDIFTYFNQIVCNYIKAKPSIMDCLRAVEDGCQKCAWLNDKAGQIISMLYRNDIVDEDSVLDWFNNLKEDDSPLVKQPLLIKFINWLEEASEESN